MRVTLRNGVTLEFDSTGMAEDFRECDKVARALEKINYVSKKN